MNIKNHVTEIKYILYYLTLSIILTSIICYTYKYETFYIITRPLVLNKGMFFNFIVTNIFEILKTYVYLSLWFGLLLNVPIITFNYLKFKIPGLLKVEYKLTILTYSIVCGILLIMNFILYKYFAPEILNFLTSLEIKNHNKPFNINLELKLQTYLSNSIKIVLTYNALIAIYILLTRNQKNNFFLKKRKYIYLILLTAIAFITPPDFFTLVICFIPNLIFLEFTQLTIYIKKYYNK